METDFLSFSLAASAAKNAHLRGVTHPAVDARQASRAKQPGRELGEFTVTVSKPSNEEKQDVRVCARDAWTAQNVAMFYTKISFMGEKVEYEVENYHDRDIPLGAEPV